MLTAETIHSVPLFAAFDLPQCTEIATCGAEIVLPAGGYAVYEGEAPSFFCILEGTLALTKYMGAQERLVETRTAGDYLGDVPILLGTASPVSARATAPTRLLRLDAAAFRRLLADLPAFARTITSAMMRSLTGLQELALATPASQVALSGAPWEPAAYQLRDFLARNEVLFTWETLAEPPPIAGPSAAARPLLSARFNDGTQLTNPTLRQLAEQLEMCTRPPRLTYDLAIIGAGPAGLSAAVYAASEGLRTLLLERVAPGGQAGTSSRIENYLGFPAGIAGDDLSHRALNQARRLGAEVVVTRSALALRAGADGGDFEVELDGGDTVRARAVLLTTGVDWRRLAVPGLDQFLGRGVYYGAARTEIPVARDQEIFLVGGGNSAGQAAMFFSGYARQVTLLVRKPSLAGTMSRYLIEQLSSKTNIRVEPNCEVTAVTGGAHLESISVTNHDTRQTTSRPTSALFVLIGADARTAWLPAGIACDGQGYLLTGPEVHTRQDAPRWPLARDPYFLETSLPGIFAAGDVRAGSVKRVAASVGEGGAAVSSVHAYLSFALLEPVTAG